MSYTLAPSLVALRNEVNARWPNRDRRSDGWIGDASHSSRVSDHNPDEDGVVHAIDVDVDGINVRELLEAVVGDDRAWYVIHDSVIRSRTYGWEPRKYTGPNPHTAHVHVSIRYTRAAETDTRSWFRASRKSTGLPRVDLSNLVRVAKSDRVEDPLPGVRLVQEALNDRLLLRPAQALKLDGKWGPATEEALRTYRRRLRRLGIGGIKLSDPLEERDLVRLGRGRFKIKA